MIKLNLLRNRPTGLAITLSIALLAALVILPFGIPITAGYLLLRNRGR